MVKIVLIVAVAVSVTAVAAETTRRNETLKITADANGIRVDMGDVTGSATHLSYERSLDEVTLTGSDEKPVVMVRTLKNGRQQAFKGERFIVSLKTNDFRYTGLAVPAPAPPAGY